MLHGNHKPPPAKVFYESVEELIDEWQASGDEDPIWEYLEMPEEQFRAWMRHLRQNKFDH